MAKEARARIRINALLTRAGWRFFDDENGPANISLETNVKLKRKQLDELGDDFEGTANGFIDYLLLEPSGFPAVVLEAKSEKYDPLVGKEQARKYAQSQNVRFVILSNGNLSYFWDLEQGNPTIITEFPTQDSLHHFHSFKPDPEALIKEKIDKDYVAVTQNPTYGSDPRWSNEAERDSFMKDTDLKFLRPYQLRAIEKLQDAVKKGASRFLFEMATGTGKTLTAAAVIKLFLRTGNAKRVLFLVDRLELEDQAWKNFVRYLKNDFRTVIYKENRDDWRKAEIVVSTVQSLQFNNKYRSLFSPTDFDLLISDEAHRSIGGNSRAVFEYFIGYKLGLTATPKDYLKKVDPARTDLRDPREYERRQLLDTYKTFGCESGIPTFRYSLIDGVKDKFLLNPVVVDARTNALRDPLSGEIGKSIVFCVRQDHATRITKTLNDLADVMFPGKYNSDFAVQVTSAITDAQQMSASFANNNLNGHTRFLEGYISSKTRVCVTVGMMTTGYDCEDLLNVVLLRPIFSPTDFIQIKGRGTRKYMFRYLEKDGAQVTTHEKAKEAFKLFDFFAVCEYFEEHFDYDEKIRLPPIRIGTSSPGPIPPSGPPAPALGGYANVDPDPLATYVESPVPLYGMKIDRKFYEQFEEKVKQDAVVRTFYEKGDIRSAEDRVRTFLFDKPEDFVNLEKLRKALHLDRRLTLREVIEKIFGGLDRFKTKEELLDEELAKFVSIHTPDAAHMPLIRQFFKAYITDNEVRDIVEKREFNRLATNAKVNLADFKALDSWRDVIPEYVKDYVHLNQFM